ncbi:MAG: hypothetical protein ACWGNV_06190 [Bacteroidales bacterium]
MKDCSGSSGLFWIKVCLILERSRLMKRIGFGPDIRQVPEDTQGIRHNFRRRQQPLDRNQIQDRFLSINSYFAEDSPEKYENI